jgi:precorrin-6Y C5,15-methyltransferase (decarboxylating)
MRAARGAQAIGIDPDKPRIEMMRQNANMLGAPRLQIVEGKAPEALAGLPVPDAVFIGGGLTSNTVFETAYQNLRAGGRLVANAVTLESEAKLVELHKVFGGSLDRIAASQAISVGRYHGMKPFMNVTQWTLVKPVKDPV